MQYTQQLRGLRQRIPIPVVQALQLLKQYKGDSAAVERHFLLQTIQMIAEKTGRSPSEAEEAWQICRADIQRAITYLNEKTEDENYVPSAAITPETLAVLDEWIEWESYEDFITALSIKLDEVTFTLRNMTGFEEVSQALVVARQRERAIFANFKPNDSIELYVKLRNKLARDAAFQQAEAVFRQNILRLETELQKHRRYFNRHPIE